ncbi:MAG: hypothetical protein ABEI74_02625 [Candidatus Pacearchaeota archaeon]
MNRAILILTGMLLLVCLTSNVSAQQEDFRYYELNLSWERGNFSLNSLEIEFSSEGFSNGGGLYSADVLDYRENVLNSTLFEVPNTVLYDNVDENGTIVSGGTLELNQTDFVLHVPYYENASEIVIYGPNATEKLRVDVGKYSKVQDSEDSDLGQSQDVLDEDEYREGFNETREESEIFEEIVRDYWWILVVVLLVLVAYLVWSFKKDN